ncbi:hypothetical protein HGH93_30790 [Chitinophaga polysaccharea]|uniref:hypothetical protein n=1 Tax=Chitinophaga polysaccharea TaxID=1293035 RepID=UPI0014551EDA|nr:hypothetical protein [Chitinophaga polysaccharea]NLR62519.1 hypothetical protein [Chitinophaga polysaccharea]
MDYKKLLKLLPFFILLVFTVITSADILTVTHAGKIRHVIAAALVLVNIVLYFFSFRMGVLLTGITLLLTVINLAAFTVSINTWQFWIGPLKFPAFQPLALLLFTFFLILNLKYLLTAFGEKKE